MAKIEITIADSEKAIPVLNDAIERQKDLLSQSLVRSEDRIQHLAKYLQVDLDRLLAGDLPHSDKEDMDLIELEGELELRRHFREQLEILGHLKVCP
jgi:hypothetical protein